MAKGMRMMTCFMSGDEMALCLKTAQDAGLKPYAWARKILVEAAGGTVPTAAVARKAAAKAASILTSWAGVTPETYEAFKRAHPTVDWARWEQAVLVGDLDAHTAASPLDLEWQKGVQDTPVSLP